MPRQPCVSNRYRMRRTTVTRGSEDSSASGSRSGSTSDTNAILEPSGDHVISVTPPAAVVSCRASPPDAGISQACFRPRSSGRRNAMDAPSGEKLGEPSLTPCVNTLGSPPGSSATMIRDRCAFRSRSYSDRAKATRLPSGASEGPDTETSS